MREWVYIVEHKLKRLLYKKRIIAIYRTITIRGRYFSYHVYDVADSVEYYCAADFHVKHESRTTLYEKKSYFHIDSLGRSIPFCVTSEACATNALICD